MNTEELIIGVIFVGLGSLLFLNNKNSAVGAAKFYQKFYTEQNLKIMFKILGAILFLGGLALIFLK